MVPGYPSLWEMYYYENLERHGVREWMFQLATIIGPEVGGPWGCGRQGLPPDQTGVCGCVQRPSRVLEVGCAPWLCEVPLGPVAQPTYLFV